MIGKEGCRVIIGCSQNRIWISVAPKEQVMDQKTEWTAKDEYRANENVERATSVVRKAGEMSRRRQSTAKKPCNCESG